MTSLIRFLVTLGLAAVTLCGPAQAATTRVTFVLVNDIYLMSPQTMPDGQSRGGMAKLATIVKTERAKGGHVIFAHAGDTLSPSLMSGLDRGASMWALTNMIKPDAFTPGNHEFDFGKQIFLQRMVEAKFPILAANLRGPDGQPLPGIKDRMWLVFDGVRIGLTGATFDGTPRTSSPEDLRFLSTVATTKMQVEALRREGADFVVALVHADRAQDQDLVAARTIDLVLSGHDHDLLLNFDERNAIVESSYDAHFVTAIDVTIDVGERDGKRETKWWPQFRVIDTATVAPDPEIAAAVANYEAELSREMDVALATTAIELDSRSATVRTREAAIGNLIADAMRASVHAEIAVTNGGGIRAGKVYAAGSAISRRDVLAELPFGNRVVPVEISGAALRTELENGLAQLPNAGGRFPQVSGLTMEVDLKQAAGARILSMKVGSAPLDPGRTYMVAINDFMARGGDNYNGFQGAKHLLSDSDAPLMANEVMTFLRRVGTLRTGVEGRIVFK